MNLNPARVGGSGDGAGNIAPRTSQNPCSLRCERSMRILSSLQARIRALTRSVKPGPVSGDAGQRNGTPCPKALGRLQTGPMIRCIVDGSTPKRAPILRTPSLRPGLFKASRICSTRAADSGGLPRRFPSLLARSSPARTRNRQLPERRPALSLLSKYARCCGYRRRRGGQSARAP